MEEETTQIYTIRPLETNDRNWVAHFLDKHWSSTKVVTRGKSLYAHLLPGFAAELINAPPDASPVGLLTYNLEDTDCEIITLNSLQPNMGIATKLIEELKAAAKAANFKRIWLVTTNDNMDALRFFQKRGFALVTVHKNALIEARKMKPQIPLVGKHNIPLRDEIELELLL